MGEMAKNKMAKKYDLKNVFVFILESSRDVGKRTMGLILERS